MESESASAATAAHGGGGFVCDESETEVEVEVMRGSDKMDLLRNRSRSTRRMPSKLQFDHNVAMGRFTAVDPARFHQDAGLSNSIHGADDVGLDAGSAPGSGEESFVVGNAFAFGGGADYGVATSAPLPTERSIRPMWVSRNSVGGGGFCGRCLRSCRDKLLNPTRGLRLWLVLLLLGIFAGVLAWAMDEVVELLQQLHTAWMGMAADAGAEQTVGGFLLYISFRCALLVAAVAVTRHISPAAAGSGIPEMRAVMEGFDLGPELLSFRTLVTKIVGLVLALGAGVPVGKEGPFVHTSCIMAFQMLRLRPFRTIARSPELLHAVLAAGCAAGVAAAFGAPVGGVLFSIEVTAQYYLVQNYWSAFFCAVCGLLSFKQCNLLLSTKGGREIAFFPTHFVPTAFSPLDLIPFLLLAFVCGVLGGVFVKLFHAIVRTRRTLTSRKWLLASNPYAFAVTLVAVLAALSYPWGPPFTSPLGETVGELFRNETMPRGDNGEIDWGDRPYGFLFQAVLPLAILRFLASGALITITMPCGILLPLFAIGALFGRFWGEVLELILGSSFPAVVPGHFAVLGAACFSASVTGAVSVSVIMFELTGQLTLMLPVLLGVVVARASSFAPSLYDTIAANKNLPAWPRLRHKRSYQMKVRDAMSTEALFSSGTTGATGFALPRNLSLAHLEAVLAEHPDQLIFPIVDRLATLESQSTQQPQMSPPGPPPPQQQQQMPAVAGSNPGAPVDVVSAAPAPPAKPLAARRRVSVMADQQAVARYEGCATRPQLDLLAQCWSAAVVDEAAGAPAAREEARADLLRPGGLAHATDATDAIPRRLQRAQARLVAALTRDTRIDVLDKSHVLVDTDFTCTHVTGTMPLSFACFLFTVHRFSRIFVTHSGFLCGYLDPEELSKKDL